MRLHESARDPVIMGLHLPRRARLIVLAVSVVAIGGAVALVPQARWRVQVIALHLAGRIPDIDLKELVAFMLPGSDQSMTRLIETHNPHAVIRNARTSAADIAKGSQLFHQQCSGCHGADGTGGPGAPALIAANLKHGQSDWAIYRTIHLGVAGSAMPPHPYSTEQLWQLVAFIRAIDAPGLHAATGAAIASELHPIPVSSEELENVHEPAADWLTYSGSFSSTRHSALKEIDAHNVARLALKWVYPFDGVSGDMQASPIVRSGVLYLTVPPGRVVAIDAATGKLVWLHQWDPLPGAAGGEFGVPVNRGVAILGEQVFVGTGDARLIALSATTGHTQWQTRVSQDPTTYYISAAPLAYRNLVVTGVGTKGGGRGFVAAFDAATGAERWRFVTVPGPGESGHESWGGDSWRNGGAPTWLTGSYDPVQDLLLWGVGNPKPDYDADVRPGDNVYSNCVVALHGRSGKLAWYFQFTPADDHDWDSNQIPVLAERGPQHLLLWANRNGFFYELDRGTGKFLLATPFVQQNWTDGIDRNGRPLPRGDAARDRSGFMLYPGNVGGTNWWSPTFDPDLNLMYVPSLEQGMVFFPSAQSAPTASNRAFYTSVRAIDAATGKIAWQYARAPRIVDNSMGGLLSTRGGVVFGSDQTTFFALDAKTGTLLWSVETGGKITAAPVTYSVDGKQFVAITAGHNLMSFGLPSEGPPTIQASNLSQH
jgi:alcohol dehydrogenase (cytochrome c)